MARHTAQIHHTALSFCRSLAYNSSSCTHGINLPMEICRIDAPRSCSRRRSSIRNSAFTGECTLSTPWKLPVTTFTLPSGSLSAFPTAMDPLSNSSPSPSFVDHHSLAWNRDILVNTALTRLPRTIIDLQSPSSRETLSRKPPPTPPHCQLCNRSHRKDDLQPHSQETQISLHMLAEHTEEKKCAGNTLKIRDRPTPHPPYQTQELYGVERRAYVGIKGSGSGSDRPGCGRPPHPFSLSSATTPPRSHGESRAKAFSWFGLLPCCYCVLGLASSKSIAVFFADTRC